MNIIFYTFLSFFVVTPSFAQMKVVSEIRWQPELLNGPTGREHALMWVDESTDHLFVAGGWGFSPVQGVESTELWQLSLENGTWKRLPTIGDFPSPVGEGTSIPGSSKFFYLATEPALFGRREITWPYILEIKDGVGIWKRLSFDNNLLNEMITRSMRLGSMIYNQKDGKFYSTCSAQNCQTYSFELKSNGVVKTELIEIKGDAPSGRVGYSYGFDQELQKLVIVSGQDLVKNPGVFFEETLILDLSKTPAEWTVLKLNTVGRRNPSYAFNQNTNSLVVWGGTSDGVTNMLSIHTLDLTNIQQGWVISDNENIEGLERSSGMGVYDSKRERLLLGFGNSLDAEGELVIYTDLWSFY